jgi:hypothetical protein
MSKTMLTALALTAATATAFRPQLGGLPTRRTTLRRPAARAATRLALTASADGFFPFDVAEASSVVDLASSAAASGVAEHGSVALDSALSATATDFTTAMPTELLAFAGVR